MAASKLRENVQSVTDELQPGTELMRGQYKITRYLNSGGFGITYLATDSLDRSVVIKECFPRSFCYRDNDMQVQARSETQAGDLRSIVRLFANEARSLSKLKHPHIVGVHQTFEENNTAYMALDFVKGHDLLAVIERKVVLLRPDQVQAILEKVLDAIGFVHQQGLLHRDISPDNIIITNELNPVLIDFGAAREQATKASRALSALRVVKDGYSPQEFYIAGSEQGPYSDLYSLAASFYQLVTGELPPDSQLRISAHVAGEADPYVPLALKTSDYEEPFCEAIDKAMSVLPANRVQSADEWLAVMSKPVARSRRSTRNRTRQRSSRLVTKTLKSQPEPQTSTGLRVLALSAAGLAATVAGVVLVAPYLQTNASEGTALTTQVAASTEAPTPPPLPAAVGPMSDVAAPADSVPLQSFIGSFADGRVAVDVSVDVPFALDDALVVTTTEEAAPAWLETGLTIREINGTPLSDPGDFGPTLMSLDQTGMVHMDLVLEDAATGTRMLGQVSVPVTVETRLDDRFVFESAIVNGDWLTRVVDAPETSELLVGDVLVGPVANGTRFDSGDALARLLTDTVGAGAEVVEVAVSRDGLMSIAQIDLRAAGN